MSQPLEPHLELSVASALLSTTSRPVTLPVSIPDIEIINRILHFGPYGIRYVRRQHSANSTMVDHAPRHRKRVKVRPYDSIVRTPYPSYAKERSYGQGFWLHPRSKSVTWWLPDGVHTLRPRYWVKDNNTLQNYVLLTESSFATLENLPKPHAPDYAVKSKIFLKISKEP